MSRGITRSVLLGLGLVLAAVALAGGPVPLDFEAVPAGTLPAGWTVEATNPRGGLASWKVVTDGENHVLEVVPPEGAFGGTYNLCWTKAVRFADGEITVRLKAGTGKEDQGGGPMWRVRDRNNYYVARYNPLEHNFRVYFVKDGARKMLDSAPGIRIPAGQWFTIRIVQHGDHIQGFLDGKKLLDVHDATFTEPGGVGLWTKADAATRFDDLAVRPEAG